MISITSEGNFKKTNDFLSRLVKGDIFSDLDRYGQMGVEALSKATPVDTRLTATSWRYRVIKGKNPGIEWYNTSGTSDGMSVAILIQYGHATGTGGYVAGRDFINPAMRPVFDKIADDVWKKVKA